jgi:hypothetical protein
MFYAGIDWADDHHDAVVIDQAGKTCGSLRIAHNVAGLDQLDTFLKNFSIGVVTEQRQR